MRRVHQPPPWALSPLPGLNWPGYIHRLDAAIFKEEKNSSIDTLYSGQRSKLFYTSVHTNSKHVVMKVWPQVYKDPGFISKSLIYWKCSFVLFPHSFQKMLRKNPNYHFGQTGTNLNCRGKRVCPTIWSHWPPEEKVYLLKWTKMDDFSRIQW